MVRKIIYSFRASVCDQDYTTMFDEELKDSTTYRAINEALDDGKSSIEIDSGELIDFVRTTKATFGIHVTDIGESIRHFFMYLSFKNNDM
jgi:hypothetical protein